MNTVVAELGPPVLLIIAGLCALGLWKAVNHQTKRERKVENTDPLF